MTGSSGWTLVYPLKTSNGSIFSWQKYQGQENIEEEGSISSIIWFQSNIIVGYLTGFIQIHRIEICIHKETNNPVDSDLLDTAEYKSILLLKAEFLGSALVCNGSFYGMALSPLTGLPFRYFAVHQRNVKKQ